MNNKNISRILEYTLATLFYFITISPIIFSGYTTHNWQYWVVSLGWGFTYLLSDALELYNNNKDK